MAWEAPSARPTHPPPSARLLRSPALAAVPCLRRARPCRRGCAARRSACRERRSGRSPPVRSSSALLVVRAQIVPLVSGASSPHQDPATCRFRLLSPAHLLQSPYPASQHLLGVSDAFLIFGVTAYSPPAETRVSYTFFAGFPPSRSLPRLAVLLRLLSCRRLKFGCAPRCLSALGLCPATLRMSPGDAPAPAASATAVGSTAWSLGAFAQQIVRASLGLASVLDTGNTTPKT